MYRNPFEKGRLIVQFVVDFPEPKQMTPKVIAALDKCLPPRIETIIPDDAEEAELHEYHDSHTQNDQRRSHGYAHMEDDDDEGQGRPGAVQCGTQ